MSYDNTNKGAVWTTRAYRGRANVHGTDFDLEVMAIDSKSDRAPTHTCYLRNRDALHATVLFKPKSADSKAVATGVFDQLGVRVNVFKNDRKSSDRAPDFQVTFRDMENQEPHPPQEEESQDNDTPF